MVLARDAADQVKRALVDPRALCDALGLSKGSQRQSIGLSICCPSHGEKNPSCSVTRGPDGGIRVKCFGCELTGDALTLVALARGLDLRNDFQDVIREGARIAGISVDDDAPNRPAPARQRPAPEPEEPERGYPPIPELEALWADAGPVVDDHEASAALVARRVDPDHVTSLDLARVIHPQTRADRFPAWAKYRGVWWRDTGHRMLVKVYDSNGDWQSVRAWRIIDGTSPKRLPPGGHRAAALVLANPSAVAMLRGEPPSTSLTIVEGEPDWIVRSTLNPERAVIGVLSGSWHPGFTARVPYGGEVLIRTHLDKAGEGYAFSILQSVRSRAQVYRVQIPKDDEAA